MKGAPFLIKGSRGAVLVCVRPGEEVARHVVSGRATFVWETFLMRRASGVPGEYRIRGARPGRETKWHLVNLTIEEAEAELLEWGFLGPGRVKRAQQTREGRKRRGLPVA